MASTIADGDYFIINGRSASTGKTVGDTPVWRLYNPNSHDHFYTSNYNEYMNCVYNGWTNEGLAFVCDSSYTSIPVYRLYHNGDHLFTTSVGERNRLRNNGWTDEGIAFYGALSSVGRAPVYRLYGSGWDDHIYTADPAERDRLKNSGWTYEGIAFHSAGVYALDAQWNSSANETNVILWPYNPGDDAQIWHISTRSNGSRRIMIRWHGKSLDIWQGDGKPVTNGQNIQLYDDHYGANQSWDIVSTSTYQTFQGTRYQEYNIKSRTNSNWVAEVSGADYNDTLYPGKNVDISWGTGNGEYNDRAWIFIPVPSFRPNGGVYSIRPLRDTSKYLDCGGTANGANVYIYSRYSGSNTQFWIFTKGNASYQYQIRNVGNGRMLDVYNNEFKDNQNVIVWNDNDQRNQQWSVGTYGSTVVSGITRQVVTLCPGNSNYLLDDAYGKMVNGNNVIIFSSNNGDNQRWVLIPETITDPTVPVPQNLYLNSGTYRTESGDRAYQSRLYPSWSCTDAWFYGANHYEFRWHHRLCLCSNSSWTTWSDWTNWQPVAALTSGLTTWLADGIDTGYDTSIYKNMEIEFGVRCIGTSADYTQSVRGGTATATHRNTFVPTFTFDSAGFSFDGLRISYTTDYPSGKCYLYLQKLEYSKNGSTGWTSILTEPITYEGLDSNSSISIPIKYLNKSIPIGSTLRLTYQKGNDQQKKWTWRTWSNTVKVARTAGNVAIDFKAYSYIRHTGIISMPILSTNHVWIVNKNHAYELVKVNNPGYGIEVESGRGYYLLPYVWNGDSIISASITSADNDRWGTNTTIVQTSVLDTTPVHVWITEDGDIVCLDCREGQTLESDRNLQSDYQSVVLNSREHEFVTFGTTVKNSFSAEGAIMYSKEFGYTDCTVDEVESLVSKHCFYRNTYGRLMSVAVTGVSVKTHHHYATVTVDMIEETR